MPSDALQTLGPFRLRVDPAQAEVYSRETGGDGSCVPLSFPAVWIADRAVFDPIRKLCEALDVVPVHESQNFAYDTPLAAGATYDVNVFLRREETPPRLIVDATIHSVNGGLVGKSETMLRLVPRAGFGAAS
jgi:hypothetical protein